MKHILDSSFRYRPSFDTDVRRTFEKARRQQHSKQGEQQTEQARQKPEVRVKVLQLDQLKKASAG